MTKVQYVDILVDFFFFFHWMNRLLNNILRNNDLYGKYNGSTTVYGFNAKRGKVTDEKVWEILFRY